MTFISGEQWGMYRIFPPNESSCKFRVISVVGGESRVVYADVDLNECRMWCLRTLFEWMTGWMW